MVTTLTWKLLIEDDERDSLPTMRSVCETEISGPFANSMQKGSIGREFLMAVGQKGSNPADSSRKRREKTCRNSKPINLRLFCAFIQKKS